MILKIMRYGEEEYCMFDNIRNYSKAQFKQQFTKDFDDEVDSDNVFILDYEDYLTKIGAGQSERDVIRLKCRLSNGNEFIVLFDTVGYILNDNGKTIEKLVANHK